MKVLVLGPKSAPYLDELKALPPGVEVVFDVEDHIDVALLCMGNSDTLEPIFAKLTSLEWVHSLSAGVEQVLFPGLVDSGVILTNARGVFAPSLAEWAVGAMLFFAKDFRRLVKAQEAKRWERFTVAELEGKALTIVGYGQIGHETAKRARALGMQVTGIRTRPALDGVAHQVLGLPELHASLARADVVMCALPSTRATKGVMDARAFGAMERQPLFINVGRGQTVDEEALVQALAGRRLSGAALDVFATEPLPASSPLWTMQNVLLSPHCADQTGRWLHLSTRFFVENVHRRARGEPLQNTVDKRAGY